MAALKTESGSAGPGLTELVDKGPEWEMLAGALSGGRLGGTLLFFGPDGAGKSSLAFSLAAALNCLATDGRTRACGSCDSCRKVAQLTHPDVIWSPPLPGSFYKSGRLDEDRLAEVYERRRKTPWLDVRHPDKSEHHLPSVTRIRAEAEKSCHEGRSKVFIITATERLRLEAANAFLKLLEEPREGVTLILCSERPSGLLPTILSRCRRLRVRRPGLDASLELLSGRFGLDREAAGELLAMSDANLTEALRLLDQESFDKQRNWVESAFSAALARGLEPSFTLVEDRSGPMYNRGDFERFTAFLAQSLREALVSRLGGRSRVRTLAGESAALNEFSTRVDDPVALIGLLDRVLGLGDDLGRNVNLRLLGWSILTDMRKAVGNRYGDN